MGLPQPRREKGPTVPIFSLPKEEGADRADISSPSREKKKFYRSRSASFARLNGLII